MAPIDVLLPTCNRLQSLIFTLGGLASQSYPELRVVISDQSDQPVADLPVVQAFVRILRARGGQVELHYRVPSKGIAEQRQFLLGTVHFQSSFIPGR